MKCLNFECKVLWSLNKQIGSLGLIKINIPLSLYRLIYYWTYRISKSQRKWRCCQTSDAVLLRLVQDRLEVCIRIDEINIPCIGQIFLTIIYYEHKFRKSEEMKCCKLQCKSAAWSLYKWIGSLKDWWRLTYHWARYSSTAQSIVRLTEFRKVRGNEVLPNFWCKCFLGLYKTDWKLYKLMKINTIGRDIPLP
jgi:hypothetical protein